MGVRKPKMEQRTLKIGDRVVYCYEDGSVEFLSQAKNIKNPLIRTFGSKDGDGYKQIQLKLDGRKQSLHVHRLIALAFHPNPSNLPQVDHINRNRSDNRACNLKWVDAKANADNQASVENCIAKYGVRYCENKKQYKALNNKDYQLSHVFLNAKQPNGKKTKYYFNSTSDPVYLALKPLSMIDRYYKYHETKGE